MEILPLLTVFVVCYLAGVVVVAALASHDGNFMKNQWHHRLLPIASWASPIAIIGTTGAWWSTRSGEHCQLAICQSWHPSVQYLMGATWGAVFFLGLATILILLAAAWWEVVCDILAVPMQDIVTKAKGFLVALVAWPYWLLRAAWRTLTPP